MTNIISVSRLLIVLLVVTLMGTSHSSAYALIDLNVSGNGTSSSSAANSNTKTGASAEVNGAVQLGDEASTNAEGTNETYIESQAEGEEDMRVTRSQISETEASASMEASAVLTREDLRAYAGTMLRADASVDEVNFKNESVEVRYKQKGKFLALVPVTFTARAEVKADGEIELDYPWYSVLTVDSKDKVETELKVAVDNALRARTVGSVKAEGESLNPRFSPAEAATVAAQIHATLKANLEAQEAPAQTESETQE